MGKKQIIVLVVFLLILGALIGSFFLLKQGNGKKKSVKKEVLLDVDFKNVNSFSYTSYGQTTTYEKKDNKWKNIKDKKEKVDTKTIDSQIAKICSAVKQDSIKKPSDYDQYGFTIESDKVKTSKQDIVLKTKDGKTYNYYVGISNPYNDTQCYVMIDGDKTVYISDAEAFTSLGTSQEGMNQMPINGLSQ